MPDFTDADYQALARFRWSLRHYVRAAEEAARQSGLTPSQHQLLLAIRGFEGATLPSVTELAERLELRVHSVLELVQRAESAGLVGREADDRDGRRHLVCLTALGEQKLAELHETHRDELLRARTVVADAIAALGEHAR